MTALCKLAVLQGRQPGSKLQLMSGPTIARPCNILSNHPGTRALFTVFVSYKVRKRDKRLVQ